MNTLTIPGLHKAKHRGPSVLAGQTPTELKQRIAQLKDDNRALIADSENNTRDIHTALIRGCQDSMRIAVAEAERDAAVTEVKKLQQAVITQAAEHERLAAANRAWEARYANEHPVSVPAPRDLQGGVLPLRDALQPKPVTNPGQTTWGARNEQEEVA